MLLESNMSDMLELIYGDYQIEIIFLVQCS